MPCIHHESRMMLLDSRLCFRRGRTACESGIQGRTRSQRAPENDLTFLASWLGLLDSPALDVTLGDGGSGSEDSEADVRYRLLRRGGRGLLVAEVGANDVGFHLGILLHRALTDAARDTEKSRGQSRTLNARAWSDSANGVHPSGSGSSSEPEEKMRLKVSW